MKRVVLLLSAIIFFFGCNNTGGGRGGSWTDADRSEMTNSCIQSGAATMGIERAKTYCTCMQQKMEVRFPDPKDAAKVNNETMKTPEMQAMVRACLKLDSNKPAPWTEEQFQKYLEKCTAGQNTQGMTEDQAITYCGCMTRKVAVKYTYEVAARMTPADFQTEEWKTAASDCKANAMRQK